VQRFSQYWSKVRLQEVREGQVFCKSLIMKMFSVLPKSSILGRFGKEIAVLHTSLYL